MKLGIPKEEHNQEHRIALTPGGCESLLNRGHKVLIQNGAGEASGFPDERYREVGVEVVYSEGEVFGRAEIVTKIAPLTCKDSEYMTNGQTVFAFHHMAVESRELITCILEKRITAIGWELIEENGIRPILTVMSEIAGQMAIITAAENLQNAHNGRGILLGGIPGIPQATVVIIGAGTVGMNAVMAGLGLGGQIIILDRDLDKLRDVNKQFGRSVATLYANQYNLKRAVRYADVVIGAVLIPAERTPHLITEDMVKSMKKGSVLIDISIDQGGISETSRPTTLADPTYVLHDVIHHCVPNMTSNVSRSATQALTNASLPYVIELANTGCTIALKNSPALREGTYFYMGLCVNKNTSEIFDLKYESLTNVLKGN